MDQQSTQYSHGNQPQEVKSQQNTPPQRSKPSLASTFGIVFSALAIAFLLTLYIFQSYQVDGPSMNPTLHNGDRLVIWKTPRTWARITGNPYIPNRGDIIVFVERGLVGADGSDKQLIKRVIGVPGDRIVIKDGKLTVYNNEHPQGFNPDTTLPYGEGKSLRISRDEDIDERLGANQLFVMGDNRDNSLDSRVFGPLDTKDVIGKLVLRLFPLQDAETF